MLKAMRRALEAFFLLAMTSCAAGIEEPPTGSSTSSGSATSASGSGSTTGSSSGANASSTGAGGSGGSGGAGGSGGSGASSTSTADASSASSGGAGGCSAYGHTIAIDGTDDFAATEKPATSSNGYGARVAWDDTYLYIGMKGADVASGSSTRWLLAYFSGPGGTTTGVQYNTQAPTLPFSAKWHVRWRADNMFTNAMQFAAGQWSDAAWSFTGDVFQAGDLVEIRIPRADIGALATVDLHLSMINEAGGGEFTFAGTPSTSFTDAVDPDYTKFYRFDLEGCDAPSAYAPM